jgi:uncharacterized protein (TIGR03437 family)
VVAADRAGNVFFATQNTVLRLDGTTGILTPVAGNGTRGFSGDNGPATSAQLSSPGGLAVDPAGNLYIADNLRIRKVSNGVISTVAGNGIQGFSGDGPATSAQFNFYNSGYPNDVAVDSAGNVYVVDSGNKRIRKISNGVITTVAGNGMSGFSGDNGPATSAQLNEPHGIAVDSAGTLYIADWQNNRIRKVANGVITTAVGTGARGFSGDGGPAASAQLAYPQGVAVDSAGNLYIADSSNSSIRKVTNGVIATVAGNGTFGFSGDGGPATSAQLNGPTGVAVDSGGNLYIADQFNQRFRKVSNGVITTVAGGGSSIGDNGPATSAQFAPSGIAVDIAGNLYIADWQSHRIRKVTNGVIATVAGNGTQGFSGDNGPATSAQLNFPEGVAVDSAGNLYIADEGNNRIRKVSDGVITTVAGNGARGFSGDGGPATSAQLDLPAGVAVDSAGSIYIADYARIRKVSNGVITTVAGNGIWGFSGDNGPATSAQVIDGGIALDSAGNLYIADTNNYRVRKISNGVITTIAGDGIPGFSGDNGLATSAQLSSPGGVAVDSAGNLYISDEGNNRIRKVSGGVITTIAGNGTWGYSGDGGPATSAQLSQPGDIAIDSAGDIYIADWNNGTIRVLTPASCTYSVSPTAWQFPASGGSVPIFVQTAASCPWAVSGLPGWITVAGTASNGAASASVALAAGPNNTGTPLSAIIVVAGVSVTVTQPAPATVPLPPIKSVVNAASYVGGPVSLGEMVTIFGTVIGPPTAAYATVDPSTGKLATMIGGVQVLFSGIPAPMIYAGSTQVSAVVPYEIASVANPSVRITYEGQTADAYPLSLAATAPGLFSQNASGGGQGAILNQDNTLNWMGNPATQGSIVQMFLTGEGQTNPPGVTGAITTTTLPPQVTPAPALPIQVWIDGQSAVYTYAGEAPGMVAGVMQLNVRIPANVRLGPDLVLVSIGGKMTQPGIIMSVRQATPTSP